MLNRIASELSPAPGRWRRAARTAGIAAGGAALTAALQINDPLGLTLLYNFGAPAAAFPFASGLAFLISAGSLQWLSLALGGALLTWPLAHLGAFVILSILSSYLIYASPHFGRLWVWAQVPLLTSFYLMVLEPGTIAKDNAQIFAGLAVAVGLLWLCNSVLWPCAPALTLGQSILAMTDEARQRLHRIMTIAIEGRGRNEDPQLAMAPRLGYHLTLLTAAMRQARTLGEAAALLFRVIVAERLRYAISDLEYAAAALAEQPLSALLGTELAEIAGVLESLLQEHTSAALSSDESEGEHRSQEAVAGLSARIGDLAVAQPSLAAMLRPLADIARILATHPSERPSRRMAWPSERRRPNPATKRFLLRFSLRHTLALTIAFLVGLWDNSPALHAAIWLLMLGGPPSHGATARKFTIRAIGAGAALSLAAIATIILAPNFGSLPGYAAAIFAGTLPLAYVSESGGILAYLGIGGTAFVIAFSGPGPRPELTGSIWTIWGITFGMVIRAVLASVWREIPGRTLAEQFQAPLEALIGLAICDTDLPQSEHAAQWMAELVDGLAHILTVAQDAGLEGSNAAIVPASLIAVLDLILRSGSLLANSQLDLSATKQSEQFSRTVLINLRRLYIYWLDYLTDLTLSGMTGPTPLRAMINASAGLRLALGSVAPGDEAELSPDQVTAIVRRLIELTNQLEHEFTLIARDHDAA